MNAVSRQDARPFRGADWVFVATAAVAFVSGLSAARPPYSLLETAAQLALGAAYCGVGVYGWRARERAAAPRADALYFAAQLALGTAILSISRGEGFSPIVLLPLAGQGAIALPRRGMLAVCALVMAAFLAPVAARFGWPVALRGGVTFLPGVVFTVVVTGLMVRAERARGEVARLAAELGAANRQLGEYAAQVEELATAKERNRLARDLHDSVKQHIFAISMSLGAARALWDQDPQAARRRLEVAFELARQSQQELTAIIQTLRPVELAGKGVRQALRDYLDRWQEQSRIAASYEAEGDGALPLGVEEALFRVTQEALANVARHSGAPAVRVALRSRPGEVELEVSDTGQGFDQQRRSTGVGLASMRERVEAVGGTLAVTSGAGGTTLLARVPLPDEGGER